MVSDRKLANAVGGKSARACDNCIKKRARWYCAADDAFLCQSCDSSVHSANPLARRHERVRLKTASPGNTSFDDGGEHEATWHQGFTRKARTPRNKKHGKFYNPIHLVPEICSEEQLSHEENEEQLLYRVPIYDPSVGELRSCSNEPENTRHKTVSSSCETNHNNLQLGFLPSEMDLAEFAADVESLLGKGLEGESFDMEGLGILDDEKGLNVKESKQGFVNCSSDHQKVVKVEEDEVALAGEIIDNHHQIDVEFEMGRETFELNFDCHSPITCGEGGEGGDNKVRNEECKVDGCNKRFLKLDYEGVLSAWDGQKSPWTTGERPEFNAGDWWPDCLGTSGTMHVNGDMGVVSAHTAAAMADGGREARVSRYREKRRTRLFSKKIRYEVRKLNAEKRPRMKGRFVKRANFVAPSPAAAFPLLNK